MDRLVLWHDSSDLSAPSPLHWIARNGLEFGIDLEHVAMAADGAAAITVVREVSARRPLPAPEALLLVTPVLGPVANYNAQDPYLAKIHREEQHQAEHLAHSCGWPLGFTEEQLRQLPPTLVVTAEIDGFRDNAESFSRRLVSVDNDGTAIRFLGAMPYFTWLDPLLTAPVSVTAHQAMVAFLQHFLD